MSEQLVLNISELRRALDSTLRTAAERFGDEVVLRSDYYWHLPTDAAFDICHEPEELTVGQLSDDLTELTDPSEPGLALWHDLQHLVGLLRAIENLSRHR